MMLKLWSNDCCSELQEDLDKLHIWSKTWKLDFNTKKCHVLEMAQSKRSWLKHTMGNEEKGKTKEEKELKVMIQDDLSTENMPIRSMERHTDW